MTFDLSSIASSQSSAVDSQAEILLKRAQAAKTASSGTTGKEDAKIEKAGKDFESILLGSWLQQAENSFATVPGGDGSEDDDGGKDQFQGIAMQALAGSLTKSGGIGIANMITQHLRSAAESQRSSEDAKAAASKPQAPSDEGKSFE